MRDIAIDLVKLGLAMWLVAGMWVSRHDANVSRGWGARHRPFVVQVLCGLLAVLLGLPALARLLSVMRHVLRG